VRIDEDRGKKSDYLELFNGSGESIDMTGWELLLAGVDENRSFILPETHLESGEHLLVFYSGATDRSPYHTGFKLPGDGGVLTLRNSQGEEVNQVVYPPQRANIAYLRYEDGINSFVYDEIPSPGRSNEDNGGLEPELDPQSKKYRQNLRMALREAGLFNELVQAWLDEAALFGGSPSFEYTAQWHLDAGTQALVKEQHILALEHLTVSVSLDDQQPLALSNLGVALERLQQWDAAKAAYRRAIELDPRLPNPRFGLALMLSREGKQAEAIREAESLVQINPNDANAKSLLAQLRAAQK
jgi:tetratricopeptide (TPR) repeat protein